MLNDAQWAEVEKHREWLENAPEEELMKDPIYRRQREWARNAPEFRWRSYRSQCESEEESSIPGHYSDGVLTPVSLFSQPRGQAALSTPRTSPPTDTYATPPRPSSRKQASKPSAMRVTKNQRREAPASPARRPMTRSHKPDLVALDYGKKGVVVAQKGREARTVVFAQYMRKQV